MNSLSIAPSDSNQLPYRPICLTFLLELALPEDLRVLLIASVCTAEPEEWPWSVFRIEGSQKVQRSAKVIIKPSSPLESNLPDSGRVA